MSTPRRTAPAVDVGSRNSREIVVLPGSGSSQETEDLTRFQAERHRAENELGVVREGHTVELDGQRTRRNGRTVTVNDPRCSMLRSPRTRTMPPVAC